MNGRLIVADDPVDGADAVDHVIVFLMFPNIFEQRPRPLLNRLVVVLDEIEHGALGSVVYDTGYFMANLIAVSPLSARDREIGAKMIIGFVFCRNDASVGPSFILAI